MSDQMLTFCDLQRHVTITGTLKAKTAFRIGAGRDINPHTPDLPVMRDLNDYPFIPGSSLKGVMRSAVERIARTLAGDGWEKAACLCTGEKEDWCVEDPKKIETDDDEAFTCELYNELCRVCRVFGSPWFAAKLRLQDLFLDGDNNNIDADTSVEVRNGVAIDRDTGRAADKKVYKFQAAIPELTFKLRATVDNPTDEELGLVLIGFKLLENQEVRLGGATSRGLGVLSLLESSYRLVKPNSVESITQWLCSPGDAGTELDTQAYISEALKDLRLLNGGTSDA